MNWQPIETAPKDRPIMLATDRIEIGQWCNDNGNNKPRPYWRRDSVMGVVYERRNWPTHWAELPEMP